MQKILFFVFALSLTVLQKTTGNTLTKSDYFTALDFAKIKDKCERMSTDWENSITVENPPDEYTIVVGKHEGYPQTDRKHLLQCEKIEAFSFQGYTTAYEVRAEGNLDELQGYLYYSTDAIGRASLYDLRFEYEQNILSDPVITPVITPYYLDFWIQRAEWATQLYLWQNGDYMECYLNGLKKRKVLYKCCENCDKITIQSNVEKVEKFDTNFVDDVREFFLKSEAKKDVNTKYFTCDYLFRNKVPSVCTCADTQTASALQAAQQFSDYSCKIGEYVSIACGTNENIDTYSCKPCSGHDPSFIEYTSKGSIDSNNCAFQCKQGYYYNIEATYAAEECLQCADCDPGYEQVQSCSNRGVVYQNTIYENRNFDTVCSACLPGKSVLPGGDGECVNCPVGKYNNIIGGVCISCNSISYSSTPGSVWCNTCGLGKVADSARTSCTECTAGKYRANNEMMQCNACPPGTSTENEDAAATCIPCPDNFFAQEVGSLACSLCPNGTIGSPSTIATDDLIDYPEIFYRGSVRCNQCNNFNRPSLEKIDLFLGCSWQCKPTLFFNSRTQDCDSCQKKCGPGFYRPACATGATSLPNCVGCEPNKTQSLVQQSKLQVNYVFIDSPYEAQCQIACLPGYDKNNKCANCSEALPSENALFVDDSCNWECSVGFYKENTGCVQCETFQHPKTIKNASTLTYYASAQNTNPVQYVDFAACKDTENKEYGVLLNVPTENVNFSLCGNGILEISSLEQCDDGNTNDGDGCSGACELENNYYDCDIIGQACKANCGWANMNGYYLLYENCSSNERRKCGTDCVQAQRLDFSKCDSTNRGCYSCSGNTFAESNECKTCGEACPTGYYGMHTCSAITNASVDSQNQRGCYACQYPHGAVENVHFTSSGARKNDEMSCSYTCKSKFFCNETDEIDALQCNGECIACKRSEDLDCAAGYYFSSCSLYSKTDSSCETCRQKIDTNLEEWTFGCSKQCIDGVAYTSNGKCVACKTLGEEPQCLNEYYFKKACTNFEMNETYTGDTKFKCLQCPILTSNEKLENIGRGQECIPVCKQGLFWSTEPTNTSTCVPCTAARCNADQKWIGCTRNADTQCINCDSIDANLKKEYFLKTNFNANCYLRCVKNYALFKGSCYPCKNSCLDEKQNKIVETLPGFYTQHECELTNERDSMPVCQKCDESVQAKPVQNAHYTNKCEWQCNDGFYEKNVNGEQQCEPCIPCNIGQYNISNICNTVDKNLPCAPCENLPENAYALSNTEKNCEFLCKTGYLLMTSSDGKTKVCKARWAAYLNDLNATTKKKATTVNKNTVQNKTNISSFFIMNRPLKKNYKSSSDKNTPQTSRAFIFVAAVFYTTKLLLQQI